MCSSKRNYCHSAEEEKRKRSMKPNLFLWKIRTGRKARKTEALASSGADPGRRSLGSRIWGPVGFRDGNARLCGEKFMVWVLASEMYPKSETSAVSSSTTANRFLFEPSRHVQLKVDLAGLGFIMCKSGKHKVVSRFPLLISLTHFSSKYRHNAST